MKNLINALRNMSSSTIASVKAVANYYLSALYYMFPRLQDVRGDLATNTIGAIIIAVVIIGLLVIAINAFFPASSLACLTPCQTKLNANW